MRSRGFQVSTAFQCGSLLRFLIARSFWHARFYRFDSYSTIFLPSSKFGGTCPPQGIFALQKSLRGGLQWGTGVLIAEQAALAQRNFQRKFALRRVGSAKFVVPPIIERSKVRRHARLVHRSYRAAPGSQRGRTPLFSEGVQRKPFPRVSFGQLLRRGSTRRFFAQLRSVGSNLPGWQASAS